MKRTTWGVLLDEQWSMDVYDTREEAAARLPYDEGQLPLVRITEEVVDFGTWTDLDTGGA